MRIVVFGLGYVGSVTIAALADQGHDLVGVDPNPAKVDTVNSGQAPVVEQGLAELIARGVQAGRIRAVTSPDEAFDEWSMSIVCVGTPSLDNGSLDLRQAVSVCEQIGARLTADAGFHTVVLRSTMVPGSTDAYLVPALERTSGRTIGSGFGVCYNPEFLREGSSIRDYYNPPFTLIGSEDERAGRLVSKLYEDIDAEIVVAPVRVAEMLKYASNSYHALKVAFANEIGAICGEQGVDGRLVMDIFARDEKLNISRAYLRPGFAYGGSCLPKDLRALVHHARSVDVDVPVLEAIDPSNRLQIERALHAIINSGKRRVGIFGLSFKSGTDDLRESPAVELTERLIGKGFDVAIYDRNVSIATLQGSNREFITREIPHIASLMMTTIDEVVAASEMLVIANGAEEFRAIPDLMTADQVLLDLVGVLSRGSDHSSIVNPTPKRATRGPHVPHAVT